MYTFKHIDGGHFLRLVMVVFLEDKEKNIYIGRVREYMGGGF